MDIFLYGAVPLGYSDVLLADRRSNNLVDERVMMEAANEAADAINLILAHQQRNSHISLQSKVSRMERKSSHLNKLSLDWDQNANDADFKFRFFN